MTSPQDELKRLAKAALPPGYIEKHGAPDIPVRFLIFLASRKDRRGRQFQLRAYQVKYMELLWQAWKERRDISVKQTRQVGKTVLTAYWLAYMIVFNGCSVVIVSTKTEKTRKISRIVLGIMRKAGRKMDADGVYEARFADSEAGYVCLSGKPEAQREGDTADIVLIDEAQDVDFEAVYPDVSPMRAGVNGIMVAMGIGGVPVSFIENIANDDQALSIKVRWQDVVDEIPGYERNVERARKHMSDVIFRAHFECDSINDVDDALIPRIVPWDQAFPGVAFDIDRADEVVAGFDWGKRTDASAGVAVARFGRTYVMFSYVKYKGIGYAEQLAGLMEWQQTFHYDALRPEENGVGMGVVDIWRDQLKKMYDAKRIERALDPVYTAPEETSETLKRLAAISQNGRLVYVDDGLHAEDCVNDLKRVGVKYLLGGRLKATHSDWLSALICCFYPSQKGVMRAAA